MSIPLKHRKVIKEAIAGFEERLKEASTVSGVELKFVDNTAEIYAAMAAIGESEPDKLKYLPDYASYLVEAVKELARDDVGKEGLANLFNSTGGNVKFLVRDKSASLTQYWVADSSAFGIEIREDSLGCWSTYYSTEALEKIATVAVEGVAISLTQRKNLKKVEPEIAAAIAKVSAAYGSELTWDPEYGRLWNWLVEYGDGYATSKNLGNATRDYVVFFADSLAEFVANPDNKEALQEKLTSNKLGFTYLPKAHPKDVNWAWDGGKLTLEVVGGAFGYWISSSYYSSDKLEATL